MLKQVKDTPTRLSLLGNYLEGIKATVFRQTQFAEFELRMHEMGEKGQPITGDALAQLYLGITKKYYGHDQQILTVDDYVAHEWSFIPHFYRDFYVFQYATSFTAAEALSAKVLSGDKDATRRYIEFLSAGGSKYPIELLKDAGVDMTTDEPLNLTIQRTTQWAVTAGGHAGCGRTRHQRTTPNAMAAVTASATSVMPAVWNPLAFSHVRTRSP
jgi:oligoendopeptidase F